MGRLGPPGHSAAAALLALAIGAGLSLPGSAGLGRSEFVEELACEEAVARLDQCCHGFDPHEVNCEHDYAGCDGESRVPDVTVDESECIRERSCRELVALGVCERVLDANRWTETPGLEVCP